MFAFFRVFHSKVLPWLCNLFQRAVINTALILHNRQLHAMCWKMRYPTCPTLCHQTKLFSSTVLCPRLLQVAASHAILVPAHEPDITELLRQSKIVKIWQTRLYILLPSKNGVHYNQPWGTSLHKPPLPCHVPHRKNPVPTTNHWWFS